MESFGGIFHEVTINTYDYFEAVLPSCYNLPDGDTVCLCVKHGTSAHDDNRISGEVWARISDLSLSGLVMTFGFENTGGNMTADAKILNHLTGEASDEFEAALRKFVDWHIRNVG